MESKFKFGELRWPSKFKGIVHPRMIVVNICSPSYCSEPKSLSFFGGTQNEDILVSKQFWLPLTSIL